MSVTKVVVTCPGGIASDKLGARQVLDPGMGGATALMVRDLVDTKRAFLPGYHPLYHLATDGKGRYRTVENKKPRISGAFCGVSVLHGTLSYTQLVPEED